MISLAESRIGQIAIVCKDVSRARDYYQRVLGLQHLFDAPPGLSFFECGGVRLMLTKGDGDATGTSVLYFFVSDIENAAKELTQRGAAFAGEPHRIAKLPDHDLWLAEFHDSEGNVLCLMEEKRQVPEAKLWSVG